MTSAIMKCFERLVKRHICSSVFDMLDSLQFAYRSNRAMEDAITLAVHNALTHLEKGNKYVRMLFVVLQLCVQYDHSLKACLQAL